MKICSKCKEEKSLSEFHKDNSKKSGVVSKCKVCSKIIFKKYYDTNKTKMRKDKRDYYYNNKVRYTVYAKTYREINPEKVAAAQALYRKLNAGKINAYCSAYRASKLQATPLWADKEIIEDFYKEAEYHQMQLDHIVPLNSDKVCGLHCEDNMQLLTQENNQAKGNRYWPNMWDY